MTIKIETGVPIPPKGQISTFKQYFDGYKVPKPKELPWGDLKLGQSFLVKGAHAGTLSKSAVYYASIYQNNRRFLVRATYVGARVWRIY